MRYSNVDHETNRIVLNEDEIAELSDTGSVALLIPPDSNGQEQDSLILSTDEMACTIEDLVLGEQVIYDKLKRKPIILVIG